MIDFICRRMNARTRTPILSDAEIEQIAEQLLMDYKPELLEQPGRINALHFLESYLGATIDFQDIYYPEGASAILGAAVFADSNIRVFDRERMRTAGKSVYRKTILLDNSLMQSGKDGLQLFTALHEGGHLYLHAAAFSEPSCDTKPGEAQAVVCCRRRSIGFGGLRRMFGEWTDLDFREHQANVFAASIAMPRKTFVPYVQQFFEDSFVPPESRFMGNASMECFVMPPLLWHLYRIYGVSKTAALVQLKKYGLYVRPPKKQFDPMEFPY